jgi:hypothetical protein
VRIRTIKPEFWKDDELAALVPLARLLFQGLWCMADRKGRLEDRPKRIKAEVLPYDNVDVNKLLDSLAAARFIVRYDSEGKEYIQVRTFEKHQRISGKEAETESEIPDCPDGYMGKQRGSNGEATGKQSGNNGEAPETTGKEGKGKERKGKDISSTNVDSSPDGDQPAFLVSLVVSNYRKSCCPPLSPRVRVDAALKKQVVRRWDEIRAEGESVDPEQFWFEFFERVAASDFLMGKVSPSNKHAGWRANLRWLLDRGWVGILEGKYENARSSTLAQLQAEGWFDDEK